MNEHANILVCPLDWGIGHATRCVPIIHKFIEAGTNVIIASDKRPLAFLQKEFPLLQFIQFPGYDITYPEKGSMVLKMSLLAPSILQKIRRERKLLNRIIDEHKIDIVISDNRYGLWNKKAKCIFITHQITIKCPRWIKFLEYFFFRINKHYIQKFDECWIPDIKGLLDDYSGSLSNKHERLKNTHFIGLLSRFDREDYLSLDNKPEYDILFVLSGPEPQRTVFEDMILEQLKNHLHLKVLIIRGITESCEQQNLSENVKLVSHLETSEFAEVLAKSSLVICRPGYSSIMDILTMGVNAYFVPTQGQTEQEYLARYYYKKNMFYYSKQQNFDIMKAINKSAFSKGIRVKSNQDFLITRINSLLS